MRLQKPGEFSRVRETGQRLVCGCLILNWKELPAGAGSRLGVVTSRRLGSAVVRTRARRLLREAFRLHRHQFRYPVQMVLVARASLVGRKLQGVETDFLRALRRADLLDPSK
jgi:ribonuclease P protein component